VKSCPQPSHVQKKAAAFSLLSMVFLRWAGEAIRPVLPTTGPLGPEPPSSILERDGASVSVNETELELAWVYNPAPLAATRLSPEKAPGAYCLSRTKLGITSLGCWASLAKPPGCDRLL
jgi:hypothetical protein